MEKSKKRKRKIVLISVLCVVTVLLVAVVITQYNNISAMIKAYNYDESEISEMVNKNKTKLENNLMEKVPDMVSDFTPEEEEMIMSGEMTIEEAVKKKEEELAEKMKNSADEKASGTNASDSASKSVNTEKTNEITSKKLIEFYSLKAYYLGQLGQLEAKVIADYSALPQEKKNLVGKKEVAGKYLSVANALLSQCDAKVDSLLKELESDIKAVGGDLSVISTIRNAYENEKTLKKAYYMSKLK